MARARQVAGVVLPGWLDPRSDIRGVAEEPDLVPRSHGKAARVGRQPHRLVECAHQGRQSNAGCPHDEQLVRLVGRDEQRRAQLAEQRREAIALAVMELDGGRGRGGSSIPAGFRVRHRG